MDYDIAIIGGGVIGCAVARELSQYRVAVLLLERGDDVSLGASKANSGIVHGGYDAAHGTLKSQLSLAGNRLFPQWEQELQFGFETRGGLVLAFSPEQEETLHRLAANGRRNGVPDLELLDGAAVRELEPSVNPAVTAALFAPNVGVCSPYELTGALAENAVANGVDLRLMSEVTALQPQGDGYRLSLREGRGFTARRVVNAAGVHAGKIAAMLGIRDIQIHPRKGQYLLHRKGTGEDVRQVVFQAPSPAGKGVLVAGTYHGNLMIGPNAQLVDSPEDRGTDLETLREILATAQNSIPDCTSRDAIRSFAGIRATSSTKDFVIRREADLPGMIQAAGIDSPGLTAAPAIAALVLRLLQEDGLELAADLQAQRQRRRIITRTAWKNMLPMKEANALTKLPLGDPRRIVCRCEQVREATIRDALTRGVLLTSTDAVKRRTRAGMGMCQGRFCAPRVAGLMADEYGLDTREITRPGDGSGVELKRI